MKRTRHFTLVELLVAMAVLVIMMGFLFDFVIGAQKVWSSSSSSAAQFDQAQLLFNYLSNDLRNMEFSTDPTSATPFYSRTSTNGGSNTVGQHVTTACLGFVSHLPSRGNIDATVTHVGTYPVIYYFRRWDANNRPVYKIYRVVIDDIRPDYAPSSSSFAPYCYLGKDYANQPVGASNNFFEGIFTTMAAGNPYYDATHTNIAWPKMDVLAENVLECSFDPLPALPANGYATSRPAAIRITLTVFNPQQIQDYDTRKKEIIVSDTFEKELQATARTFTKVVFLK